MTKIKEKYSCSLLLTMDLIGGKWKLRILWHIIHGDNRFSLLARAIPDITQKMLTTQLKELEISGLINRKVYNETPIKVEYEIHEEYKSIEPIIEELCSFTKMYAEKNDIYVD